METNFTLSNQEELEKLKNQFENSLSNDFNMDILNKNLKFWYTMDWKDFKKEILKTGVKLTYPIQSNWEIYFHSQKEKVLKLSNRK